MKLFSIKIRFIFMNYVQINSHQHLTLWIRLCIVYMLWYTIPGILKLSWHWDEIVNFVIKIMLIYKNDSYINFKLIKILFLIFQNYKFKK